MKYFPFLYLAFILPLPAGGQNLADIRTFEQSRYAAILAGDTSALAPMLSEDLVYTHSHCVVEDKRAYLQAIGSRKYTFTQFETDSTTYRFLQKKIVVATGVARMAGRAGEVSFALRSRFTAVYVQRKKQWRLHSWQTTKCQ